MQDLEVYWYQSFPPKIKFFLTASILSIIFFVIIWVNVIYLTKQSITFKELITTFVLNRKIIDEKTQVENELSVAPVQRAIWICLASIVAAISLTISGAVIQSLTQNPLADSSTLGFLNSTIFGIILMKGIFSNLIESQNYHIFYFLFSIIGGIIALFLLSFLFNNPQNKSQNLKIILIGLVLNTIFRTFTYLIKTYNANTVNSAFALAMGGAENVYGLYTNQFTFLKWCTLGLISIFLLCLLFSKQLNLFELGEEQAKTLGVNVKVFKYIFYTVILATTTISILLVGNIAFLGLICTHSARNLFNTRKYQIIIPIGSMLACILLLFGILLNSLFPFISSSIFILFLGGIVLLWMTLKNTDI